MANRQIPPDRELLEKELRHHVTEAYAHLDRLIDDQILVRETWHLSPAGALFILQAVKNRAELLLRDAKWTNARDAFEEAGFHFNVNGAAVLRQIQRRRQIVVSLAH